MYGELTLEQAWKFCLAMWKWIAKKIEKDRDLNVWDLKREWLRRNYDDYYVRSTCFFCHYASQMGSTCEMCPGYLVNKRFRCGNTSYNYELKPIKFYKQLVKMNKKRLAKLAKI